jgi:hypothetical protein
MKKIQILGLALVAVFAFSVVAASVASAEITLLAEWLINGAPVATLTSTEGTGKLILKDAKIGIAMECSGILDGSVGANGEDETTEVLIGSPLAPASLTNHIICTGLEGCGAPAEAAPEELPWLTQAELLENGTFGDIVTKAKYWSMCNILGILVEEECTVENGLFLIKNLATDVEGEGTISPLGPCTSGGANSASQTFVAGNLVALLSGTLAVSSE